MRIKKVVTIGSDKNCDYVLIRENVLPVHCQIIKTYTDEFFLLPFSEKIKVIGNSSRELKANQLLKLDFEAKININYHNIYWQQWFCVYALNCNNCKYSIVAIKSIDRFCQYCMECNYNPPPMIFGFNPKFNGKEHAFYYWCEDCGLIHAPFDVWCIECNAPSPEPLWRSWEKHIKMYDRSIESLTHYPSKKQMYATYGYKDIDNTEKIPK